MTNRYAQIEDGLVRDIIVVPTRTIFVGTAEDGTETAEEGPIELTLADIRPPETVAACVPCGPEVEEGWTYDSATFAAPVAPAPTPEQMIAYAQRARDRREAAGTTVNGYPIRTDRETRSALIEAKIAAEMEPGWSTPWSLGNGQFLTIDAALLGLIIPAVAAHRRQAFVIYEQIAQAIGAGTITDIEDIDAAFAAT